MLHSSKKCVWSFSGSKSYDPRNGFLMTSPSCCLRARWRGSPPILRLSRLAGRNRSIRRRLTFRSTSKRAQPWYCSACSWGCALSTDGRAQSSCCWTRWAASIVLPPIDWWTPSGKREQFWVGSRYFQRCFRSFNWETRWFPLLLRVILWVEFILSGGCGLSPVAGWFLVWGQWWVIAVGRWIPVRTNPEAEVEADCRCANSPNSPNSLLLFEFK